MTEDQTPKEKQRDENMHNATATVSLVARFDLKVAPDTSALLAAKAVALVTKYLQNAGGRDGTHIDPETVGVVAEKVTGAVPARPRPMAKDRAWDAEQADLERPLVPGKPLSVIGA